MVEGYIIIAENKTTEFKREYIEDIKNSIIVFANCDGGTLYIGVNDDGTVCGVDNVDGTMLRAVNAIRDAVRPDATMFVECDNDLMDEKPVVRVTVQRGTARPYYLHGKGIRPEGVSSRSICSNYIDRYNRIRAEFSGLDRLYMRDYPSQYKFSCRKTNGLACL